MRPHGSFSCWMYGQAGGNPANGCRCDMCGAAHSRHRYRTTPPVVVRSEPTETNSTTPDPAPPRPVADLAELAWRAQAACLQDPLITGIFYPSTVRTQHTPDITQALAICDSCPVTTQCLGYALEHDEPGIWGGTTPADRHLIQRHQQAG